jgi:integrase
MAGMDSADTGQWGLVVTASDGSPLRRSNFRRRIWLPSVEQSGLSPLTYHQLRHSHAAILIAQGEHPQVIADRLGHASPNVTNAIYSHSLPGLDAAAAERLDQQRIQNSDGLLTDFSGSVREARQRHQPDQGF